MCFSKADVILALYGPSCVGKSTLAKEIGRRWGVPVRHCGGVLKTRAAELGASVETLSLNIHKEVDEETRRLAREAIDIFIIEGRYLDLVLSGIPRVRLLRLICNEMAREQRFLARVGSQATSGMILRQHDQEDLRLRHTLYGDRYSKSPDWMVLDTTDSRPEELLALLVARLRQELLHDKT